MEGLSSRFVELKEDMKTYRLFIREPEQLDKFFNLDNIPKLSSIELLLNDYSHKDELLMLIPVFQNDDLNNNSFKLVEGRYFLPEELINSKRK